MPNPVHFAIAFGLIGLISTGFYFLLAALYPPNEASELANNVIEFLGLLSAVFTAWALVALAFTVHAGP